MTISSAGVPRRIKRLIPADRRARNLFSINIAGLLLSVAMSSNLPLVPLVIQRVSGGTTAEVTFWTGLSFGVTGLLGALIGPIWGRLADQHGHKVMVMRALFFIGLAQAAIAFASSPEQVVAIRVMMGLLGVFSVASIGAVTTSSRPQELGQAIGAFQAMSTLGGVFGPLAAGIIADTIGPSTAFLLASATIAIALLSVYLLYTDLPRSTGEGLRAEGSKKGVVQTSGLFRMSGGYPTTLLIAMAVLSLTQFSESGVNSLLSLILKELGAPESNLATIAGLSVSLILLAMALSALAVGRLSRRFSPATILTVALTISTLSTLGLLFSVVWWQVVVSKVLLGAMTGVISTLCYTIGAGSVAVGNRGTAAGYLASSSLMGGAAGPFVGGLVAGVSFQAVFGINLVLYSGATVVNLVRRRQTSVG